MRLIKKCTQLKIKFNIFLGIVNFGKVILKTDISDKIIKRQIFGIIIFLIVQENKKLTIFFKLT